MQPGSCSGTVRRIVAVLGLLCGVGLVLARWVASDLFGNPISDLTVVACWLLPLGLVCVVRRVSGARMTLLLLYALLLCLGQLFLLVHHERAMKVPWQVGQGLPLAGFLFLSWSAFVLCGVVWWLASLFQRARGVAAD